MIYIDCLQGSEEWLAARAGVTTSSIFADAISTVGGLTDQQRQYVDEVLSGASAKDAAISAGYKSPPSSAGVAKALKGEDPAMPSDVSETLATNLAIERISGKPYGIPVKAWVLERGHEEEANGRRMYEAQTGEMVYESGLVMTDDRKFGYSTDGFVNHDGMIEAKSPINSLKILRMLQTGDVTEYLHQIQGGLWITGRIWCDLLMPVPDLSYLFVKRIFRDENFIDSMVEKLIKFDRRVEDIQQFLLEKRAA